MTVPNNDNTYLPGTIQIPSSMVITAITNAFPMVVTVIVDPVTKSFSYIPGQCVRLNVPYDYGMFQANGLTPKILSVSGLNLILEIDSTNFDVFTIPVVGSYGPATISPNGSRNLTLDNTTGQVPFQSLNNIGN